MSSRAPRFPSRAAGSRSRAPGLSRPGRAPQLRLPGVPRATALSPPHPRLRPPRLPSRRLRSSCDLRNTFGKPAAPASLGHQCGARPRSGAVPMRPALGPGPGRAQHCRTRRAAPSPDHPFRRLRDQLAAPCRPAATALVRMAGAPWPHRQSSGPGLVDVLHPGRPRGAGGRWGAVARWPGRSRSRGEHRPRCTRRSRGNDRVRDAFQRDGEATQLRSERRRRRVRDHRTPSCAARPSRGDRTAGHGRTAYPRAHPAAATVRRRPMDPGGMGRAPGTRLGHRVVRRRARVCLPPRPGLGGAPGLQRQPGAHGRALRHRMETAARGRVAAAG